MQSFNWPSPIVHSRLQEDFYDLTQGQLMFKRLPNVQAELALFNRTRDIHLAEYIDENELRRELDHFFQLPFQNNELEYLSGLKRSCDNKSIFKEDYLNFLSKMNPLSYRLKRVGDDYKFAVSGPCCQTVYCEVPVLQIFIQMYTKGAIEKKGLTNFEKDLIWASGKLNLKENIEMLKDNPGITFIEFGTRRASNHNYHDYVISALKENVRSEQFLGTSNTYFAMKHGIRPVGTNSHSSYQIYSSLFRPTLDGLIASQRQFLYDWYDEYGPDLATFLPDTFTSDFFFDQVMTKELANIYRGARQDSGDPNTFIDNLIRMYQRFKVDPATKKVTPSDGLHGDDIPMIKAHVNGRMQCDFGWGSHLSNNMSNPELKIWAPKNLSLVIKVVEANGRKLVKLSDNPEKAIGDPDTLEQIKAMIGYRELPRQRVIY